MELQELAEGFCKLYMLPDDGWLQKTTNGFVYWPTRLAQHFSLTDAGGGVVKWQCDIPVVRHVRDAPLAHELLLRLNRYSTGWSLAYKIEDNSVHALIAMAVPPEWDRFWLRFSEAAKLAAWFCDSIADPLAHALSAKPCYSWPDNAAGPRETPDAVTYMPTALRERPEWVLDPVPFWFPSVEEIAERFRANMGEAVDSVELNASAARFITMHDDSEEISSELEVGFATHPLLGMGWRSAIHFPWSPLTDHGIAGSANAWEMFHHPRKTLLGSWTRDDSILTFQQWSLTSELRGYEQLRSFTARDAGLLWSVTSTASDAIGTALQHEDGQALPVITRQAEADRHEAHILIAFAPRLGPELELPTPITDHADRSLLWLDPGPVLLVVGWFNPIGPTLSTLEIRTDRITNRSFLVHFMRHPFMPQYQILVEIDSLEDLARALPEGIRAVFSSSLPNFLSLDLCPEPYQDLVTETMRHALQQSGQAVETDWDDERSQILKTLGDPWAFAGESRPEGSNQSVPPRDQAEAYDGWLAAASRGDNFYPNIMSLPDAWDGALNFQKSHGAWGDPWQDLGPFVVINSCVGRTSPTVADRTD